MWCCALTARSQQAKSTKHRPRPPIRHFVLQRLKRCGAGAASFRHRLADSKWWFCNPSVSNCSKVEEMFPTPFDHFLSRLDGVGWSVLVALLLLFVCVVAATGARLWLSWRQRGMIAHFRTNFSECNSLAALTALAHSATAHRHPFGRIVQAALSAHTRVGDRPHRAERLYRALQTQLERETAEREWGMTLLATAATTAPYLGLLGTVWSIYHALTAIALSGESSLAAVAGPVGEALIMTAIGLAVAIPAAIAHNLFARGNRLLLPELEACAHECYLLILAETAREEP